MNFGKIITENFTIIFQKHDIPLSSKNNHILHVKGFCREDIGEEL